MNGLVATEMWISPAKGKDAIDGIRKTGGPKSPHDRWGGGGGVHIFQNWQASSRGVFDGRNYDKLWREILVGWFGIPWFGLVKTTRLPNRK